MEEDVREGIRVAVGAMNAHDEVRQRVRKRRTLLRRAIVAALLLECICYGKFAYEAFVHHGAWWT